LAMEFSHLIVDMTSFPSVFGRFKKNNSTRKIWSISPVFSVAVAGVWWGANPRCMLLLCKGLIGSVLDYSSVCYSGWLRHIGFVWKGFSIVA
jgi:hypothetical protein